MTKNYAGFFGFVTQDGCVPEEEVELPDKAAVNEFIAKHRDADKVDIAIGTHEIAHSLLVMEKGHIVRAPHYDDMCGGIGTPELLAAQEARRRLEEDMEDARWCPECGLHYSECRCDHPHPICRVCGGEGHYSCE